jgi:hypothetical protein
MWLWEGLQKDVCRVLASWGWGERYPAGFLVGFGDDASTACAASINKIM